MLACDLVSYRNQSNHDIVEIFGSSLICNKQIVIATSYFAACPHFLAFEAVDVVNY